MALPIRKGLQKVGNIAKGIIKGIIDPINPNLKNSFEPKESQFLDEAPKYRINVFRLMSALTIWILLIMVFFGKIKFESIQEVINNYLVK